MFKFRKIASVLASVFMVGSSVAVAAAANFPAPFVSNGAADVAVVWGTNAANTDLAAVLDITASLQEELTKQTAGTTGTTTTTTGGDSVNIGDRGSQKLYYGDALNAGLQSVTSSELPHILATGTFVDQAGTEYGYSQTITPGGTVSTFGTSGGDLKDPALYLDVGTDLTVAPGSLYNYTLSLNKVLNVSDPTNVQGQKLNIMGVDYIVGASSTSTALYLYGSGETLSMNAGDSKTVTVGGAEHVVDFAGATTTTVGKISVDGVSRSVTKGSSYAFAGDINVYVKDVTYQAYAGGLQSIDLIVGAKSLLLANGAPAKQGADQTQIRGTLVTLTGTTGLGITKINVQVAAQKSQTDSLVTGQSITDPVFGGFKVVFAGEQPSLNITDARAKVVVDTDNNQFARVTFTSARAGDAGEEQVTYAYDNTTSTSTTQPILAYQTVSSSNGKGRMHVLEGENGRETDRFIVNQGDSGTIVELTEINANATATTSTVTFEDAITGVALDPITLTWVSSYWSASGQNIFGGTGYTINLDYPGNTLNITWNSAGKAIFPRVKMANGGWIAFLANQTVQNVTSLIFPDGLSNINTVATAVNVSATSSVIQNGINWTYTPVAGTDNAMITGINAPACSFAQGPAILIMEPKKWNDASFGNFICVPMSQTTGSSPELSVGQPVFNGTNSGWNTLTSDTFVQKAVDKYGTSAQYDSRTNENNVATFYIPKSQMYLDVLFASDQATVTPGTSGSSGSTKILGSVSVKDSEVSSVADKSLIVVGGSCINTVASDLLGSSSAVCGADFTTKTGVGANQFLIQTFSRSGGNVATLVAGYNAADTTTAAKVLTTQTIDTSVGKKYIGDSATQTTTVSSVATNSTTVSSVTPNSTA